MIKKQQIIKNNDIYYAINKKKWCYRMVILFSTEIDEAQRKVIKL